jgi:PIN domain nuclease of toxin-antitoxin system
MTSNGLAMQRTSSPSRLRQELLLIDTHVWLWLMEGEAKLSPMQRQTINDAAAEGRLRLSVISIWEVALLASRNRIALSKPIETWIDESLIDPAPVLEPLSPIIALASCHLPGGFRSDPADQIIVATARVTGAMLMTRDRRILDYAAAGHVNAITAQRGSVVFPKRNSSIARAHCRPSRIAQTTSDWPRRMSPAENTFGTEVL